MPKLTEQSTRIASVRMIELAEEHLKCREKVAKKKLTRASCEPSSLIPSLLNNKNGGLIGGIGLGGMSGTGLSEKQHTHSGLGRMLIDKPSRIYKKLQASMIFNKLSTVLENSGFHLVTIDKSSGILFGVLEKGVIRSFWFWEWQQKQYAIFVLLPVIGNKLETRLHYLFWVEEKPPLSSEYVEIKNDHEGRKMMRNILIAMDRYVTNEGGEL